MLTRLMTGCIALQAFSDQKEVILGHSNDFSSTHNYLGFQHSNDDQVKQSSEKCELVNICKWIFLGSQGWVGQFFLGEPMRVRAKNNMKQRLSTKKI